MTIRSLARRPAQYAKRNRAPAALLLFAGLVGIAVLRRGAVPDQRGLIAIAGAAIAMVMVASFAPDLVFTLLLVTLLVAMFQNADVIAQTVSMGSERFKVALAEVA